jgi:hypothetical protein
MVTHVNTIKNALQNKGLTASNTLVKFDADGTHTESYWRREFEAAYLWLFANETLGNTALPNAEPRIFQLGADAIFAEGIEGALIFEVIDSTGRLIQPMNIQNGNNALPNDLPSGIYYLRNERFNLRVYKQS